MGTASTQSDLGSAYVAALSRKDFKGVSQLLDPEVDFRGLTPGRAWEATGRAAVEEVLSQWFEEPDDIEEVISIDTGSVADRRRVAYRFRVRNPDGTFLLEQQAYYTEHDGHINWMRVLCSGFRPQ